MEAAAVVMEEDTKVVTEAVINPNLLIKVMEDHHQSLVKAILDTEVLLLLNSHDLTAILHHPLPLLRDWTPMVT